MLTTTTIGTRIRVVRRDRGLTTYELAEKAGISRAQLSRIENGHSQPRIDTLEKLAKALRTTASKLLAA